MSKHRYPMPHKRPQRAQIAPTAPTAAPVAFTPDLLVNVALTLQGCAATFLRASEEWRALIATAGADDTSDSGRDLISATALEDVGARTQDAVQALHRLATSGAAWGKSDISGKPRSGGRPR